ncbi:ATP-binding protein [Streptomyces sp. NPDC087440]|uniref:ATP-binding protein n=1 Tax=Streptomyces sp. NPDC087440 TaxID=3365790 RepID=UPI003817C18C
MTSNFPSPSGTSPCPGPSGLLSDAVRVPRYLGLRALHHLRGKEGGIAVDSARRHLYFLVPSGAATGWELPHTTVLDAPHALVLPDAGKESGPGPYWLHSPRPGRVHSDAAVLHAALREACGDDGPVTGIEEQPPDTVAEVMCGASSPECTEQPRERPGVAARGQAAMAFPAVPESVRRAREAAARMLAAWRIPRAVDTALLVVSELMTNAVQHTFGQAAELVLTHGSGLLLVEVRDTSSCPPAPVRSVGDAESGRGLHLVHALSTDWGWMPLGTDGKSVWALLPVRAAEDSLHAAPGRLGA